MNLYALKENLKKARQKGFIFNQILKLTIKIYCNLSIINISFFLKFRISMYHRQFFRIVSQNRENVKTNCNDRNNPFDFAGREWYSDKQSPLRPENVFFYHLKVFIKHLFKVHIYFL